VLLDAKGLTFDRIDNGGRDGDPDALSSAVPGSLAPVPWAHVPTAQVLLAMNDSKGGPFFADPRQVLRHAMKPLADMGLTAVCATELEFYLIDADRRHRRRASAGSPGPSHADGPQYGSMEDVEEADPFLADLFATCKAQNIPPARRSRNSPRAVRDQPAPCRERRARGRPRRAVEARGQGGRAQARLCRELHGEAIRGMGGLQHARAHQPRGCGRHEHLHRKEQGRAVRGHAAHAIGGLAAAMPESMAIFAPTGNATAATGRRLRAARAELGPQPPRRRAPHPGVEGGGHARRAPPGGADGNPYLVIAAILAGVHHGITNKVEPGRWSRRNRSSTRRSSCRSAGQRRSTPTMRAGSCRNTSARSSTLYGICRREEEERFHSEISDRDYEWYLRAV
jgi:glutamine synthetase